MRQAVPHPPQIRPATRADAASLAIIGDMATRRLFSHLWGLAAGPGQSPFAVGRGIIRDHAEHFSHFTNWQVAEQAGEIAGGMDCCRLPEGVTAEAIAQSPPVAQPLNALKAIAGGTWYIVALALFPEFRGQGLGSRLLAKAEADAQAQNIARLTLMVASFNPDAQRLYQRSGFHEWARRPFTPFPGSDPEGAWILMYKDIG
ncbi:GNAT family N-acetyltransferase [Acidocella sp.]|uniref:GNAT family N-acetyltransferase n=1 Tax=Acidocella sp. TaxID=50710 RepID=UPI0026236FC5|nr:GNAT family N-acetyltransferase [Acidocella sp.]